ncbi:hypothetical protein HMSSN139_62890 [Paenibacillus sp. HMSSN-139]|nr:hypothetical protein HMSSN139_62890 [Paenibacillus sp. HMSSN-139]
MRRRNEKTRDVTILLPNRRHRLPQEEAKHRKLQPENLPVIAEIKDAMFRAAETHPSKTKINRKSR